jgi:hypothetical protein
LNVGETKSNRRWEVIEASWNPAYAETIFVVHTFVRGLLWKIKSEELYISPLMKSQTVETEVKMR